MKGWQKNALRVALGLGVGCAIAELAFRARDEGAFAHVNFYVADPLLGVRLQPNAREKIRFGSPRNPVTAIATGADGYRSPGPGDGPDDIVVVGDSQTFGLGVEANETFAAVLAHAIGDRHVRNLGVPTYGPAEYNRVLKESLAKRPAKTVVWIANMANDLFEASHPNAKRHVVWDGWAVRAETAPANVTPFPGRSLLYTHSHAFLAARRWLHERDPASDAGFASEGSWKDINAAAETSKQEHTAAAAEGERLLAKHATDLRDAAWAAEQHKRKLDSTLADGLPSEETRKLLPPGADDDLGLADYLEIARSSPGDIVQLGFAEAGRDIQASARQIQRGVQIRNALEKMARDEARRKSDPTIDTALSTQDELDEKLRKLQGAGIAKPVVLSPLAPALKEAKALCDAAGARLLVVALPIDVQVSGDEWKKYGATPIDMAASRILNEDVVTAAEAIGAEGIDVLPALAAAEPGAFLDGDIHMTPKGHRAVGEAVAKALQRPRLKKPLDTLPVPAGRTRPPLAEEWTPRSEIAVVESDPAGCETKLVREWIGVFCRRKGGAKGVLVERGSEVLAGALPGEALLVAPVVKGQDLEAVFAFDSATRRFTVKDDHIVGFSHREPARTDIPGPGDTAAYCACAGDCAKASAPVDPDCVRTYANDCPRMLACAAGSVVAPPACVQGAVVAGMAGRCHALCSPEVPCAKGSCTAWQGGDICM